ncbi:MAG: hypothetical protein ACYTXP_28835 [Nostoc sp.]
MPSASTNITVEKFYSQEEFDRIAAGVIPEQMEETKIGRNPIPSRGGRIAARRFSH